MTDLIQAQADKSRLEVLCDETIASGSVKVIEVSFSFSKEWDGLSKAAVFKARDTTVNVLLTADEKCLIPWEVLQSEYEGERLFVGVYGVKDSTVVLPTIWRDLGVIREGAVLGTETQAPTPALYDQILSVAANIIEVGEQVEADSKSANAAKESALSAQAQSEASARTAAEKASQAQASAASAAAALSSINDAIEEHNQSEDAHAILLNKKADLQSPALTGTPTAPTPHSDTDSTQIATTAFVQRAVRSGSGGSAMTGADILEKLKTVDGTGSGLDADLFKGSSTIAITNGGTGATTAADARSNLGVTPENIGALPTASYTGESILTKLKTVDGTGSGLDADLFQGNSVIPIANGGTGATTAADARTNLGVTPGNIGAVSKAGDTMMGSLGISKDAYPQVWLKANNAGKTLMLQQDAGAARLYTFTTDGDTTNCRVLLLSDAGSKGDVKNALSLLDKVNGKDTVYPVLTTANAANQIQSLLQGGSISVVKSVQRGTQAILGKESSTITINAVNVNKAFVITNQIAQTGERSSDSGTREYGTAGAYLDSSTSLIIRNSRSDTGTTVFWQVVEFY